MQTTKRTIPRFVWAILALLIASTLGGFVYFEIPSSDSSSFAAKRRSLPVVSDGRLMPLDTLARESFTRVTGRASLVDPDSGQEVDPAACYLEWIATWRGWGHPRVDQMLANDDRRSFYFHWQKTDRWDLAALLPVDDGELRAILGLEAGQTHISPASLNAARIQHESAGAALPFVVWVEPFRHRAASTLAAHEQAAIALAERFAEYQEIRLGLHLHVVPPTAAEDSWPGWTDIALTAWDKSRDPQGLRRAVQQSFRDWLSAGPDTAAGRAAESAFLEAVDQAQASVRTPWTIARTRAEVKWRRISPNRIAWGAALLGLICIAWTGRVTALGRWRFPLAVVCGGGACLMGVADLSLRGFSLNQWPLTKGCELAGTMATLASCLALAWAWRGQSRLQRDRGLALSLGLAALLWLAIDPAWNVLDLRLERVSSLWGRSVWLGIHGMTMASSGVAFLLAALLGNLWLWRQANARDNWTSDEARKQTLAEALAHAWNFALTAMVVGVASGALWSDLAWGQFFRGSPKEAMALVVLLVAGAGQIARKRDWLSERGTAVLAITAASLFFIGSIGTDAAGIAGRHDLLRWEGGLVGASVGLAVQIAFVAAVLLVDTLRDRETKEPSATVAPPALRVYSSQ
ncbi:MAG: cytochrome c biogenesis protein CcsA [Pirellulales bacterium]